jgi:dihydroorotase
MTLKLVPGMTAEGVSALKRAGAVAGKYYPEGVTTNSEDGIKNREELYPILEALEEEGLVLCVHGEEPEAPVLERERAFLAQFEEMAAKFQKLKMVFEHVSTAEAVSLVKELPETVAASVTVHHLLFTLEDMMASGLDQHLYCKPVVKSEKDRLAIEESVLDGHPKFFFGSDSAPHPVSEKTRSPAASGVYSAPVALPLLIDFFDSHDSRDKLENFVSRYGAEFYGLALNEGTSEWLNEPWIVPELVDGAVPLCAGQQLRWQKKAAG